MRCDRSGRRYHKLKNFLPFKKAVQYVRTLGLKTNPDWRAWTSSGARPSYIPAAPDQMYRGKGWKSWMHWLTGGSRRGAVGSNGGAGAISAREDESEEEAGEAGEAGEADASDADEEEEDQSEEEEEDDDDQSEDEGEDEESEDGSEDESEDDESEQDEDAGDAAELRINATHVQASTNPNGAAGRWPGHEPRRFCIQLCPLRARVC